jgi:hypothetical protein
LYNYFIDTLIIIDLLLKIGYRKMKKYEVLICIIVLILSGYQAIGTSNKSEIETHFIDFSKTFQPLALNEKNDYLQITVPEIENYIDEPGSPRLPAFQKIFSLPENIRIKQITCSYSDRTTEKIVKKIDPTPQTVYTIISTNTKNKPLLKENEEIYQSDTLYPSNWYEYSIRCGLNTDGKSTTFIVVTIYPIRYNPVQSLLISITQVDLHIEFDQMKTIQKQVLSESYDLVVIAPEAFSNELQRLVIHKNSMGVSTLLKTTEEIYNEYNGNDKPEQIKYFIKYAKETWNTSYFLLVGGLKSYLYANDKDDLNQGSTAWYVPVRYTNIPEGEENGCISDLYYADLYRYNEETQQWEFENWDQNGDGIYAKWSFSKMDDLDLLPDVYVGRLPCHNTYELKIIVDKIIQYESTSPDEKPWYKKMIAVSGKNFAIWQGQPDGEFLTDRAIENMSGRIDEVVRIYATNNLTGVGPVPDTEDIVNEFSKGAGFIDFEGHGNPISWSVIEADGEYESNDWHGGINIKDFFDLSNGDKLPVVMVGGCHNGLFNVSILQILLNRRDHFNFYWTWVPTPVCFCWAMVIKPNGGAIASIGATGLGPASGGDPISLQGEIDLDFFNVLGDNSIEKLGQAHSGAIIKYVLENKMNQRETFTTTIFQLFGDPSLQLGGYP